MIYESIRSPIDGSLKNYRAHAIVVLGVIIVGILIAGPELRYDRIFPYDSASYANDGALFLTAAQDGPAILRSPIKWLWEYYDEYPALSLRRHPPLYGVFEAIVYSLTGVSVFGAQLTSLLFFLCFAVSLYAAVFRLTRDILVAAGTAVIVITSPPVQSIARQIWLDLPALTFGCWAFYWYAKRLDGSGDPFWTPAAIAFLMLLSLYTYPLAVFLLFGIIVHWIVVERSTVWKDRPVIVVALLGCLLLVPLLLQNIIFARDNVISVAGVVDNELSAFIPVQRKLSLTYWTYYISMLGTHFPIQTAGFLLWMLWRLRRPSATEWLMLVCMAITYLAFTWIPSKCERYALYIAFPASILATLALRDLSQKLFGSARAASLIAYTSVVLVACVLQIAIVPVGVCYVAEMDRPVRAIIDKVSKPKILYCGAMDAAFVFYVRAADEKRETRIDRAGVQLQANEPIDDFIKRSQINVIAFENPAVAPSDEERIKLTKAIIAYLANHPEFKNLGVWNLVYGNPRSEKPALVSVFTRNEDDS
jgi:Dolichyl-phosphate-mannose-protein mannosyltransferase